MSGGNPGYGLENEVSREVVLRTASASLYTGEISREQSRSTEWFLHPRNLAKSQMVSVENSLSYFSVATIKCSDESNLKEQGFSFSSSWRIPFTLVQ